MNYQKLINTLLEYHVEFIIVGGVAAVLQGAPIQTFDLDIVHLRNEKNNENLLFALQDLAAIYRHHSKKIKPTKKHTLSSGHQLLSTNCGDLDLLGTIDNGRSYEDLLQHAVKLNYFEESILVLGLEELIAVKARTGRPKDELMLPLLIETLKLQED